jgi:hypothetical protein
VRLKSIEGRVLKKLYWDLRVALATVRQQQSMTVTFKGEFRLSAKNKYLIFGFTVLVLFLELTAKASADSAKEQLQGTMDRVIEVLQTTGARRTLRETRASCGRFF